MIRGIIADKMDIKGGYAKPHLTDVLWVQLVILPREKVCDGSNGYCSVDLETPSIPLKPDTTYFISVRATEAVNITDFSNHAGKILLN